MDMPWTIDRSIAGASWRVRWMAARMPNAANRQKTGLVLLPHDRPRERRIVGVEVPGRLS